MGILGHVASRRRAVNYPAEAASDLRWLDWLSVLVSGSLAFGIHLDGWAHVHDVGVETFFTPWHAVFYGAALAFVLLLAVVAAYRYARGFAGRDLMPAGYGLSAVGLTLFMAGGVGDMLWHLAFGIETGVEPLLSPTHLLLALGGTLAVAGPFRAVTARPRADLRPFDLLPAIISLALVLEGIAFMTQFAHPWATAWPAERFRTSGFGSVYANQALSVAGILLQSGLLVGTLLVGLRRRVLVPGSVTVVLVVGALLMAFMQDEHFVVPTALAAGLVGDLALWRLRPSVERPGALRLFCFLVPAAVYAFYFLAIGLQGGTWWSVHLWSGAIVLAGAAGWLLAYVKTVPPAADV